MAPISALLNRWYSQPTPTVGEPTIWPTIAITGICPPSGVGAIITCIIIPNTTPPTRPPAIDAPNFEDIGSPQPRGSEFRVERLRATATVDWGRGGRRRACKPDERGAGRRL